MFLGPEELRKEGQREVALRAVSTYYRVVLSTVLCRLPAGGIMEEVLWS